jgi:hypothetical protein
MGVVEMVMSVIKKNLLDQTWSKEEVTLIKSLNPSALREVQQRCLARARKWKRIARLLREIATGRADVTH